MDESTMFLEENGRKGEGNGRTKVENGIPYTMIDGIWYPFWEEYQEKASKPPLELNMYGRMRLKYLKEYRKAEYSELLTSGTLNEHLKDVQERAFEMQEELVKQMAKAEGVTEQLKRTDQLKWVGLMNNFQQSAREIVTHNLIYV